MADSALGTMSFAAAFFSQEVTGVYWIDYILIGVALLASVYALRLWRLS
jgi:hypothetical protein